jgi:hypothetical protein
MDRDWRIDLDWCCGLDFCFDSCCGRTCCYWELGTGRDSTLSLETSLRVGLKVLPWLSKVRPRPVTGAQ